MTSIVNESNERTYKLTADDSRPYRLLYKNVNLKYLEWLTVDGIGCTTV